MLEVQHTRVLQIGAVVQAHAAVTITGSVFTLCCFAIEHVTHM